MLNSFNDYGNFELNKVNILMIYRHYEILSCIYTLYLQWLNFHSEFYCL